MRRHLPRLLLTGALLSPTTLYALGLGEIRLNSALNQPFDAEIELIAPSNDELQSLKVSLASNDLFSRYGLDRPQFLSNFQFSVSRGRDGRPAIRVSSNRSVTEPFVTLLVEARWGRGRLLREYTVLLDPPVFMPSQPQQSAAPVTTPQAGAQTGRIERQPEPQPQPAPQPQAEASASAEQESAPEAPAAQTSAAQTLAAAAGGSYTVQRNDTLWRIASSITPGGPRVVNRTMIALYRANPGAFGGNINRLHSGSVLRVPDLADIEAIPLADASAEVVRQSEEWSARGVQQPSDAEQDAARLRLVTPSETPTAPSATPPAPSQSQQQPAPSTRPGTAQQDDNRVELPSQALSDAQRNVTEPSAEPQAPAADESASDPSAAEQPAATAEPQPSAEQRRTPPARRPARPAVEEPAAPSLMERIGDYWWVLVLLGLLVVISLLMVVVRRRREESAASLDSLSPEPRFQRAAPAVATAAAAAKARDSFLVEDENDEGSLDEPAPVATRRTEAPRPRAVEPVAATPAPKASEDTLSSETSIRFDQQDALAEADFHMAYGLYDQAADLVKIAIEREPARRDLKLKLLEIYFVWGNKDLFLETARDLHVSRADASPGEWDKVLIMGKQIAPDDPMFKGEAAAAHVDLVDVNLEGGENRVDVDLFAEPEADKPSGLDLEFASGERKAPAASAAHSDDGLDFLLDEPLDDESPDEELTREMDNLARTQETPTIETPAIDRSSSTVREKIEKSGLHKASADQTAELSLDDLGLDVDALAMTDSLEDTTSIEKDTGVHEAAALSEDDMTQLAPSLGSFDRTLESPRLEKMDAESTGTIYLDDVDVAGGDTLEQPRPDVNATAEMQRPRAGSAEPQEESQELDFDLSSMSGESEIPDTVVTPNRDNHEDRFASDVFAERTAEVPRIDLDVGEPLGGDDQDPTHRETESITSDFTTEMELSELEPVTMSEVGTKLDLARAYMDMGDPDGARSILEEVLAEGNPNQKQEAQRLIESIR